VVASCEVSPAGGVWFSVGRTSAATHRPVDEDSIEQPGQSAIRVVVPRRVAGATSTRTPDHRARPLRQRLRQAVAGAGRPPLASWPTCWADRRFGRAVEIVQHCHAAVGGETCNIGAVTGHEKGTLSAQRLSTPVCRRTAQQDHETSLITPAMDRWRVVLASSYGRALGASVGLAS
jgi:hypothetical protein